MRRAVRAAGLAAVVVTAAVGCRGDAAPSAGSGGSPRPTPAAVSTATSTSPSTTAVPPGWGQPQLLATLADAEVTESSGLAASRRNPGLLWTHNDSGDSPRLFCFDRVGASCGTWPVAGATARDWEDMAAGPGPSGEPSLFLGDIGDNGGVRRGLAVHVVEEPEVGRGVRSLRARSLRLAYPDGPHDAEALLVHPVSGDLYVVTKKLSGTATVYKAAAPLPLGGEVVLTLVAEAQVPLVTGGDISPDGTRVALCSYLEGYELVLPPGAPFDDVWHQPPAAVPMPPRRQGEAVAYRLDGAALLTTSEGLPTPLHEVTRRA